MFKTTQELKEFILWCQSVKIKTIRVGNTEVQFSDYAFLDALTGLGETQAPANEVLSTSQTLADDSTTPDKDDEMLFWSAKA
jgi:hypothetical protein